MPTPLEEQARSAQPAKENEKRYSAPKYITAQRRAVSPRSPAQEEPLPTSFATAQAPHPEKNGVEKKMGSGAIYTSGNVQFLRLIFQISKLADIHISASKSKNIGDIACITQRIRRQRNGPRPHFFRATKKRPPTPFFSDGWGVYGPRRDSENGPNTARVRLPVFMPLAVIVR
jgi:hypothetical protein